MGMILHSSLSCKILFPTFLTQEDTFLFISLNKKSDLSKNNDIYLGNNRALHLEYAYQSKLGCMQRGWGAKENFKGRNEKGYVRYLETIFF